MVGLWHWWHRELVRNTWVLAFARIFHFLAEWDCPKRISLHEFKFVHRFYQLDKGKIHFIGQGVQLVPPIRKGHIYLNTFLNMEREFHIFHSQYLVFNLQEYFAMLYAIFWDFEIWLLHIISRTVDYCEILKIFYVH